MVLNHMIPCDHYLLCAHEENPDFSISAFSEEHMTGIDFDVCVLFLGWFRKLFLNPCLHGVQLCGCSMLQFNSWHHLASEAKNFSFVQNSD